MKEDAMTMVSEGRAKKTRRTRQKDGRRSTKKVCNSCGNETRWLSVEGTCWDCTVKAAKDKVPLFIEPQEEESDESESSSIFND
jgi:hypothetical protein